MEKAWSFQKDGVGASALLGRGRRGPVGDTVEVTSRLMRPAACSPLLGQVWLLKQARMVGMSRPLAPLEKLLHLTFLISRVSFSVSDWCACAFASPPLHPLFLSGFVPLFHQSGCLRLCLFMSACVCLPVCPIFGSVPVCLVFLCPFPLQ